MRLFLLMTTVLCGAVCTSIAQERAKPGPAAKQPVELHGLRVLDADKELPPFARPEKPSPERLKGMKAALADIEKGMLKQKLPSLTEPAWVKVYAEMLRRLQPFVECEAVEPKEYKERRAEIDGYNAVMRAEIESRFGEEEVVHLARFKELAMEIAEGGVMKEEASSDSMRVFAPFDGVVKAWHCTSGDKVKKGQKIVTVASLEMEQRLAQAKAEIDVGRAKIAFLERLPPDAPEADRKRIQLELFEVRTALAQRAKELDRMSAIYQNGAIAAPFDGTVILRGPENLLGRAVTSKDALFRILLLSGKVPEKAEMPPGDFDGPWIMNANGWTFTLKLTQKDDVITGTMQGINNDQTSKIEGKVTGHEITFTRDNGQEYRGYLLVDDPTGKTNRLTMAGIFRAGEIQAGWYAKR